MALELKGADGTWYTHASIEIYRKHRTDSDQHEVLLQLLASIGNELEDLTHLLKPHFED